MTAFPVGVELEIDGTWTDVSQRARRVPPTIHRGRADEQSTVAPTSASVVFDNTDGALTPRNPESPWYPHVKRGMRCRLSVETGTPYLLLSGASGSRATTPDNAALDITGDLFMAVELQTPVGFPEPGATRIELAAKYNATGNQRSYYLSVDEFGRLVLIWSTDGTSGGALAAVSTYTLPLRTAGLISAAVRLDVNNGAGGHTGTFWGMPGTLDDLLATLTAGVVDIRLGDPFIGAGTTSIHSGTAPLDIGDIQNTSTDAAYRGGIRRLQVRSGSFDGTVVANPDFTAETVGDTGFTDSAGRVWSIQGDAAITDRQTRFVGKTASVGLTWPKARGRDGTDEGVAHATVEVAGLLRQLQQGAKPAGSTLYRLVSSPSLASTVAAYWPLEDGTDARVIGSPIEGVRPGAFIGVDLSADDSLDASGPLPSVADSTLFRWRFDVPPTITADTNFQSTMFINIPTAPSSELQFMVVDTGSTQVRTWALQISNTTVRLRGIDHTGTEVINDTQSADARMFGTWMVVSLNITQDGGNIDWAWDMILIPDGFGFGDSGTIAGTCRRPTRLRAGTTSPANGGFSFGHFIVTTNQTTGWLAGADTAWVNETAAHRVWRLCREENIPVQIVGDQTIPEFFRGNTELSQLMGAQRSKTLVELLQECAEVDAGILYEQRGQEGLAFRTGRSLTNQTARLTLDLEQHGLTDPFEPVLDDQRIRNDITVKRDQGSLARVTDDTSIDSEGRYDEDITRNVASDLQLPDQAGWRLHLGTWPELRLPAIATSLLRAGSTVADQWLNTDLGDLVTVNNLMRQYDATTGQLLEGYDETLSFFTWEAGLTTSPAGPWEVGVRGGDTPTVETFNKADGALGPVLTWTQEVFAAGPHDWEVVSNQARFFVNTAGAHEDLQVPSPNVTSTRQQVSADVTNLTRTGTGSYWISGGFVNRLQVSADGTDYRGYACEIGRNNQVVAGVDRWYLIIWRIDGRANPTIIAVTSAALADVTLPGTLTFIADGDDLIATFNHAGATDLAIAVTDSAYPDGLIALGGGHTITSGDSGSITFDNFTFAPVADRRDDDRTVLANAYDTDDTLIAVNTTSGPTAATSWTLAAADYPFDLDIAGERVTAVLAGTFGAAVLWTVVRSANGVTKSHAAGTQVRLWRPAIRAL